MGDVSAIKPRTYKVGGGGGGAGGWLPPLRKVFLIFFLHGKTSAPYVFCSCSFIPRARFNTSLAMVSYYLLWIRDMTS